MSIVSTILVGAYLRSADTFDDVLVSGDTGNSPPADFSTGDVPTFPLNFLNTVLPSSWGVTGTAGTEGINRVLKLQIASVPELDVIDNTMELTGANANALSVRLKKMVRHWTSDFTFPKSELQADADMYEREWYDMQLINFNTVYVWFLHTHFAAKGYIKADPKVFLGAGWDSMRSVTLAFDHFYVVRFEAGSRFYKRLR